MANIQQLTYPFFTDGTTPLNASNLNQIVSKINELVVKVNGGVTPTQTVATPTISISGSTATISCSTSGATIYYTTNGNTPTTSSTQYTGAITLSSACTIKAIAVKSGMNNSSVASQSYTPSVVATPVISISGNSATITCATSGAQIRYTLDGTTPTANSTLYSSAITLSQSCTIKAIAIKSGMTNSSVASKSYTPSSQYSQEAQAVINKFNNMSSANQDKVADFVDALVSAGVYSKINYLMIPTVAGSVSEGVQNVLSSVAPPSISGAEIANGGLRLTSPICIDLTNMMVNSPDYANYAIGFSGISDSGATGTQRRALTFGTVPTQGTSPGADKQYIIQDVNSGAIQYIGYGSTRSLSVRSVIRHNDTTKKESYMTSGSIVSSDDTKTIDVATGMYLGSWIDDISTSVYRSLWHGTYRLLVFTKLLSDTELTALETAIQSFLS